MRRRKARKKVKVQKYPRQTRGKEEEEKTYGLLQQRE
jgi:hypothetical protein